MAGSSSDQLADSTSSLDSGFSLLGELLGLDDARGVGQLTGTENLEETLKLLLLSFAYGFDDINYNSLRSGRGFAGFLGHEGPDFVQVDSGLVKLVGLEVEMTLAIFTEVARMAAHKL